MKLPMFYPLGFYLARGPIPRSDGGHINPDGSGCVGYVGEIRERFPANGMLVEYIEAFVHPYLIGLTSYLRGEGWPWGERAYGDNGAIEWVAEKLETRDRAFAQRVFNLSVTSINYDQEAPCPCGSGRKARKCHGWAINDILPLIHREG